MRNLLLILGFTGLLLSGCQTSVSGDHDTEWSFLSGPGSDSMLKTSDSFVVDSARVQGDSLILFVQYAGGCKEHAFTPYGSDYILKSEPPQIDLWFHHDANEDHCKALINRRLAFNVNAAAERLQGRGTLRIHSHPEGTPLPLQYP